MIKHKNLEELLAESLFKRAYKTFEEVEQAISRCKKKSLRSKAFEVFVHAYLLTQKLYQIESIHSAPLTKNFLKRLVIDDTKWISGLFVTKDKNLHAFYMEYSEEPYQVAAAHTQAFMEECDEADQCCIITNHYEILHPRGKGALKRYPYQIKRQDFERLTLEELQLIHDAIHGNKLKTLVLKPYPHQKDALKKFSNANKLYDRYTGIMACATGKTLTALWHVEQIKAKTILVLVPSLALVGQLMREWLQHTKLKNVRYCAVCSDKKLKNAQDLILQDTEQMDFPVTTDADELRTFFYKRKNDTENLVKFVFCTYQSAQVVGEAIPKSFKFDISIFDEAHRTAGVEESVFSYALHDTNIKIKKRLFLTATPKHYQINDDQKNDDKKLQYSMDDEELYGPKVVTLSFNEAINQTLISPYKVLVSVVTQEMLNKHLLQSNMILNENTINTTTVQTIAQQIAIEQAVKKHNIKKIITFHGTVADASKFARLTSISKEQRKINRLHISGDMTSIERQKIMKNFKESSTAMLTNAKCLTEGVDVPSIDMVAFLSVKRSTVDIVQAIGRALRKSPGKSHGFILLPVFIHNDRNEEDLQKALQHTQFSQIWDVLNALSEQDVIFANQVINVKHDFGQTNNFDFNKIKDKIEFIGTDTISYQKLKQSIAIRTIEKLGSNWDYQYGRLLAFKKEHGHPDVPTNYHDEKLATWADLQRQLYRETRLLKTRIEKLNSVGFTWDLQEKYWMANYNLLLNFYEEYGHCNVPQNYKDVKLATWIDSQRQMFRKNKLSSARVDKLNALGLIWEVLEGQWMTNYNLLLDFYKEHGHSKVPKSHTKLFSWVVKQRRKYKNNKLSDNYIKFLENVKFDFIIDNPADTYWNKQFEKLAAFKLKHGHFKVSNDEKLSKWTGWQKTQYHKNKLSMDRFKKLKNMGFDFNIQKPSTWDDKFNELKSFFDKHGHSRVPKDKQHASLNVLLYRQRKDYENNKMESTKIKRLKSVKFEFTKDDWHDYYERELAFKNKHGYLSLTGRRWLAYQKKKIKNNTLTKEQEQLLNKLNVSLDFKSLDERWNANFDSLKNYVLNHGSANVSSRYSNRQLASWVSKQRKKYKNGKLTGEQIDKLQEIGFSFNIDDSRGESFADHNLFENKIRLPEESEFFA